MPRFSSRVPTTSDGRGLASDAHTRRRFIAGGAALGAGLLIGGCGDSDSGGSSAGTGASEFPRSVRQTLGTIEIEARPQRVVAVGKSSGSADAALASGLIPVGMPKAVGYANDIEPWVAEKLGGRKVKLLEPDSASVEAIAALRPDLILATHLYTIDDDYKRLSEIAPVVAYRSTKAFGDSITAQAALVGEALGTEPRSAAAAKAIEDRFAKIRAEHPEWKGKTFTFTFGGSLSQIPTVTDPNEAVSRLFRSFGLELDPKVRKLGAKREVSAERLDLIDADALVMFYPAAAAQKSFESSAVFSKLRAVRDGHYFPVDVQLANPMDSPGLLNMPIAAEGLLPKLEKALA